MLIFGARAFGGARQHFGQFIGGRIADDELEKETVQLRFGQRISAFLVNGILRGQDEERFDQLADFAAGGDAFFLHRFEHGGLGLGRGAVDFVGENRVRENRAALELEFAPAGGGFHDDVGAEDVGGHQVGRELDAVEGKVQHFAQRAHQQRLAEAGHAFEQHVAAGEHGDERAFDDGVVADDDLADFSAQRGVVLRKEAGFVLRFHRFSNMMRNHVCKLRMRSQTTTRYSLQAASVIHPWLPISFFQVIEIIAHGSLVGARNFFLAQRALGVRLRGDGGFLISHLALALDADALQSDARHLAAGRKLALHLRRLERVVQFAVAAVGDAFAVMSGRTTPVLSQ